MSTYVSAAVAAWAKETLRAHDATEGGWWCKGCYRQGRGKIAAGTCELYEKAQAVADAHRRPRPSRPRSRPAGERFWFRD